MTWMMDASMWLTGLSVLLLIALAAIYVRNYIKFKSTFIIGLLIFVVLFLAQNIISLYYYVTMMAYYAPQVESHVFVFTLLQAIAFAVLLKITWD